MIYDKAKPARSNYISLNQSAKVIRNPHMRFSNWRLENIPVFEKSTGFMAFRD